MAGCTVSYLGYYQLDMDLSYNYFFRININLTNPFNSNYYQGLSILFDLSTAISSPISGTTNPNGFISTTAGQTWNYTLNNGIMSGQQVNVSGNSFAYDIRMYTVPFYVAIYAIDKNNSFWWSLSDTGVIPSGNSPYNFILNATSAVRPVEFYWSNYGTSPSNSQTSFFLPKATAWNALTTNINEVRRYKGLSDYSFTPVYAGTKLTAAIYNQVRLAIQGIGSGAGSYIPTVTSATTVTSINNNQCPTQYDFYIIQSELNAIK